MFMFPIFNLISFALVELSKHHYLFVDMNYALKVCHICWMLCQESNGAQW